MRADRASTAYSRQAVLMRTAEFMHVKPGKGAAFVRSKLRNYVTGNTVERTFRAGEQVGGHFDVSCRISCTSFWSVMSIPRACGPRLKCGRQQLDALLWTLAHSACSHGQQLRSTLFCKSAAGACTPCSSEGCAWAHP